MQIDRWIALEIARGAREPDRREFTELLCQSTCLATFD